MISIIFWNGMCCVKVKFSVAIQYRFDNNIDMFFVYRTHRAAKQIVCNEKQIIKEFIANIYVANVLQMC